MRTLVLAASLFIVACEGRVSDPGDPGDVGGEQVVVIRDRSGPEIIAFACSATSVATRESFTCTAEARHPTREALRCGVELAGQTIALGDCSSPLTASLRATSPGALRVALTVLDVQDRPASKSVVLQVTGLPNQPPVVVGLSASVSAGIAPLATTLTWTSTDPEGDAVSCALDIGADGTIEQPQVSCSSWALELRRVGTVPVKVIATDSGGLTSDRTVMLTVEPPTADLRIASVEFGQTVMKAGLTLVQDKAALLRVTVLANQAGLSTTVEVEAKQGSTVLGRERLTGPAVVPQLATPADLSKSFRFMMPKQWVVAGVSLRITVDPDDTTMEADEANNVQALVPSTGRDNVLHLTGVPITIGTQTGVPLELEDALTSVWPLKAVESKVRAPYTFNGTISGADVSGWSQLLGELAQVQGADGSSRAYYGFVPGGGGGIAGLGFVGQHAAIGLDGYTSVAAHELGHNFGINHAPCGGAAGADPGYPYPNAQIGSWGFDGTRLLAPTQYADLMSYCQSVWVSDYNYAMAQQHMEGSQTFDPVAVLPAILPEDSVLIAGQLTAKGATLSPVYRVFASPSAPVDSDTRLRLITVDGRKLEVPVRVLRPAEGEALHFFAVIPWPGELAALSVVRAGVVLGSRETSAAVNADVRLERLDARTLRVRWLGDATATIAHLGEQRTTLTLGATGGSVILRTDGLISGRYEVSLSTGLRTVRTVLSAPSE